MANIAANLTNRIGSYTEVRFNLEGKLDVAIIVTATAVNCYGTFWTLLQT